MNGKDLFPAFMLGILFSMIVAVIVIALSWASEVSEKKGYDQMGWNHAGFDIEYNWGSNSIMYSCKKEKGKLK